MSEQNELQRANSPAEGTIVEIDDEEFQLFLPGQGGSGQILINPDVISRIAAMAVEEIEGVVLGTRFSFADIFPGKEAVKGIQLEQTEDGHYRIGCEVKIAYRTPIQETAIKLQRHIKETVERMTGLAIRSVDIKIIDIYHDKKEKPEED